MMKTELISIPMSVRLQTCLIRHGIVYIEDIFDYTDDDYMKVRNIGRKNIEEAKQLVAKHKENKT